jgi:hypothetical protein
MSFDEQPDGDIHGECAAESEPHELSTFEKWWVMLSKVPYMSKREIAERAFCAGQSARQDQLDACRPYLKEGETPAECLARNRADIVRLMGKWGAEKMRSAKLRDDLDKIAQTTGSDDPCRPHLKEGETVADALGRLEHSESFYRRRCEALQAWQSSMRDPERVIVCDILANGFTLDQPLAGDRYEGLKPDKARAAQEVAGCGNQ